MIPAGSVIYDHEHRRVRQVSLTEIPLAQPPFPLPNGVVTPVYFTLQPGAGYVRNLIRNLLTGLGLDEFFTRDDGSGPRGFLGDALGSTLALVDASGLVQATYTYDPFGTTSITGSPGANALSYTGREDDGTGLKYYRARYYHPGLQRFISEDPIGFRAGDPNLYAYARNNPAMYIPTRLGCAERRAVQASATAFRHSSQRPTRGASQKRTVDRSRTSGLFAHDP